MLPLFVLLTGDPGSLWQSSVVVVANVVVSACRDDGSSPEDEDSVLVRRAVAAGRLPDRPDLTTAALAHARVRRREVDTYLRRSALLLATWIAAVGVVDALLVTAWPWSAGVRHPAAGLAAALAVLVVSVSAVALLRRRRTLDRVLAS